jgi:general secretion pathway protein G
MTLNQRSVSLERQFRRAAFTLMELLIVVAIIVVLAGLGGTFLFGQLASAKMQAAQAKAYEIGKAIEMYKLDHDQFPAGLEALLQKDADGKGPYLKSLDAIKDPWDRKFEYDPSGSNNKRVGDVGGTPDVFCTVPDSGQTVGNWKEPKR